MAKHKRAYSQTFPRSRPRVTIAADWAPADLKAAALAKCAREGTSLRAVILQLLTAWVKPPKKASPAAK